MDDSMTAGASGWDARSGGQEDEFALFIGDRGDRSLEARAALNALIASPVITNRQSGRLFRAIANNQDELERDLSNHFLVLRLDMRRGVAWVEHAEDMPEGVPRIKRRANRLRRNTQVLLVMLRYALDQSELEGNEVCFIEQRQILEYFKTHVYPNELDETKVCSAVDAAIRDAIDNKCLEEANAREGIYRVTEVLASWLTLERARDWTRQLVAAMGGGDARPDSDDASEREQG